MQRETVNIALAGFGTVGTGLVKILESNRKWIQRRIGKEICLKVVLVRDIYKKREYLPPWDVRFTDRMEEIVSDPEIDIVVELIGGTGVAYELIKRALLSKKHVVTANKALLAEKGEELFELARYQQVALSFEASVGGGIPIIETLKENLSANKIKSITGILNGTANFILTEMSQRGLSFKDALYIAQERGYAEADPTLDIEGIDAAHKLSILIMLAYGENFSLERLTVEGISGVDPYDIQMAEEFGYRIKLIAQVKDRSGYLQAGVFPALVPLDHILAKVDGAFNAILLEGNAVGPIMLYGQGAGQLPTGSAVISDIMSIVRNSCFFNTGFFEDRIEEAKVLKEEMISCSHYFRFTVEDRPGVLAILAGIMGERNISIAQVVQKRKKQGKYVPVVFLTHRAQLKNVRDAIEEIDRLSFVKPPTQHYRIL